ATPGLRCAASIPAPAALPISKKHWSWVPMAPRKCTCFSSISLFPANSFVSSGFLTILPAQALHTVELSMALPENQKIYFASDFHLGAGGKQPSLQREKLIVQWLEEIS